MIISTTNALCPQVYRVSGVLRRILRSWRLVRKPLPEHVLLRLCGSRGDAQRHLCPQLVSTHVLRTWLMRRAISWDFNSDDATGPQRCQEIIERQWTLIKKKVSNFSLSAASSIIRWNTFRHSDSQMRLLCMCGTSIRSLYPCIEDF